MNKWIYFLVSIMMGGSIQSVSGVTLEDLKQKCGESNAEICKTLQGQNQCLSAMRHNLSMLKNVSSAEETVLTSLVKKCVAHNIAPKNIDEAKEKSSVEVAKIIFSTPFAYPVFQYHRPNFKKEELVGAESIDHIKKTANKLSKGCKALIEKTSEHGKKKQLTDLYNKAEAGIKAARLTEQTTWGEARIFFEVASSDLTNCYQLGWSAKFQRPYAVSTKNSPRKVVRRLVGLPASCSADCQSDKICHNKKLQSYCEKKCAKKNIKTQKKLSAFDKDPDCSQKCRKATDKETCKIECMRSRQDVSIIGLAVLWKHYCPTTPVPNGKWTESVEGATEAFALGKAYR